MSKCNCPCHSDESIMHFVDCCGEFSPSSKTPATEARAERLQGSIDKALAGEAQPNTARALTDQSARLFSFGALPPPGAAWMMGKTVEQIESVRLLQKAQELLSVFTDQACHIGQSDYSAADKLLGDIDKLLTTLKK